MKKQSKKQVKKVSSSPELEFLNSISTAMAKYYRNEMSLRIRRGIKAAKERKNNEASE